MHPQNILIVIIGIAVLGGAYFWTNRDSVPATVPAQHPETTATNDPSMNPPSEGTSMDAHQAMMDDGHTIMAMAGAFHPQVLYVSPKSALRIANHESYNIELVFENGAKSEAVAAGMEGNFTAPEKPGTYTYQSSHDKTITGTLVVEE